MGWYFFLRMRMWRRIKTQCIMIVAVPTVSGANRLTTYGTLDIGEVPRLALIEKATPNAIMARPARRRRYLRMM